MISENDIPIVYEHKVITGVGRLILWVGFILSLWAWIGALEFSIGSLLMCAFWFILAIAAPVSKRTVVDRTDITWETRWPWGVRKAVFPPSDIAKVAVDKGGWSGRPFYAVSCHMKSGTWRHVANYASPDDAEAMAALLRGLAASD